MKALWSVGWLLTLLAGHRRLYVVLADLKSGWRLVCVFGTNKHRLFETNKSKILDWWIGASMQRSSCPIDSLVNLCDCKLVIVCSWGQTVTHFPFLSLFIEKLLLLCGTSIISSLLFRKQEIQEKNGRHKYLMEPGDPRNAPLGQLLLLVVWRRFFRLLRWWWGTAWSWIGGKISSLIIWST